MFIVQSPELVRTEEGELLPLCRYVMPAGAAQAICQRLGPGSGTCSHFNSYERRYAGQNLNGTDGGRPKRLLIYRHGVFGDTLMCTSVARYLTNRFPRARIDVYGHPKVRDLWWGTGARAYPGFPPFDAVRNYDYHLLYDAMLEADWEDDQRCCYDNLFAFAGIDPATVPAEAKRPWVVERPEDLGELPMHWTNRTESGRYLLYHYQASSPARTYPPRQAAEFIRLFLAERPDWTCYLVGRNDRGELEAFYGAGAPFEAREGGRIKRDGSLQKCCLVKTPTFRNLIPLVRHAGLVVCPDSSVGHLAAAFPEVPVISLWGMIHPHDRAFYYANHHPLFVPAACPHAPCRVHTHALPVEKCRDAAGVGPAAAAAPAWCHALEAITPEMILDTAREILNAEGAEGGGETQRSLG